MKTCDDEVREVIIRAIWAAGVNERYFRSIRSNDPEDGIGVVLHLNASQRAANAVQSRTAALLSRLNLLVELVLEWIGGEFDEDGRKYLPFHIGPELTAHYVSNSRLAQIVLPG